MKVFYTDFSNIIKINCNDRKKPLYLSENVVFIVEYANKRIRQQIKRGFKSDGCTIPKIFWSLIGHPQTPEFLPASFIHDFILQHPEIVHNNLKFSSKIFLTGLLNEGVHPFKAKLMTNTMTLYQWVTNSKHKRWK